MRAFEGHVRPSARRSPRAQKPHKRPPKPTPSPPVREGREKLKSQQKKKQERRRKQNSRSTLEGGGGQALPAPTTSFRPHRQKDHKSLRLVFGLGFHRLPIPPTGEPGSPRPRGSPATMPVPNLSPFLFIALFLLFSTVRPEGLGGAVDDDACPTARLSDGNSSTSAPAPASSCPINCFRADPVCSVDGVTYWCGCPEAACAGVRVAKRGPCQVGNGGSGLVSGQALLLIHIVWLIVLGFAVLLGFL